MSQVILIPAYEPDDTLVALARELAANDADLLIVNDGSSSRCAPVFAAVAPYAHVLTLPKNSGKGAALKHGMSHLLEEFPDCTHFITADADGQHPVSDILRVRDELLHGAQFVLSVRDFQGDIPFRSRIGNNLSRFIYTMLTGHYFRDNQSGLRGFSVGQLDWLTQVGGEKYDYEMNMLYYADKQAIPITTLLIRSVYIDGNRSSHFDPLRDTLRIYRRLFASAWASLASILLVELVLVLETLVYPAVLPGILPNEFWYLLTSLPKAGFVSAAFCILMDKFVIFRRVRYAAALHTLSQTLLRFIAYTACCVLLRPLKLPLLVSFNLSALVLIAPEYFLQKLLHIAKYRDINKEHT